MFLAFLNLINKVQGYPIEPSIVTSLMIGIASYSLIIATRDLELEDVELTEKIGLYEEHTDELREKHKRNKRRGKTKHYKIIIIGIIVTILSYCLIFQLNADKWGNVISDSLTLVVFALFIFRYIYDEYKKDLEKKNTIIRIRNSLNNIAGKIKSLFSNLFKR